MTPDESPSPCGPTTLPEIRELLCEDPSLVSDAHLVALIVGKATRLTIAKKTSRSWTSVELGEDLYSRAGGSLSGLVEAVTQGTLELKSFGIGKALGARLIAAMELARRWRRGLRGGGNAAIRTDGDRDLDLLVLERDPELSEGELLAPLLDESLWHRERTEAVLGSFQDPEELMETLTLESFRPFGGGNDRTLMTLAASGAHLSYIPFCRLLAALELARRHRGDARQRQARRSGLSRSDLVKMLDPEQRLNRPLRERTIRILRSHPDLSQELARLDTLASDAGVESYLEAVALGETFEGLLEHRTWSDPAEILGPRVPYATLLRVAEARLARTRSPGRLLEVKDLLLAAQRSATREPVACFVETLLELAVSEEEAQRALEEARRLYFEKPEPGTYRGEDGPRDRRSAEHRRTLAEIRDLFSRDPARVSDAHLVALVLGAGACRRRTGQQRKSWKCVPLAEELFAAAGGRLSDFVDAVVKERIDLSDFGIGKGLGARLIAAMELARRWERGLPEGGDGEIRAEADLRTMVFEREERVGEGELLALLVERRGRGSETRRLIEHCGSPQAVIESLTLASFTPRRRDIRDFMVLTEADLELTPEGAWRLVAGLELARRHRGRAVVLKRKPEPGPSGLTSGELAELLDPERLLDRPLRARLAHLLRSHPDLAQDVAALDTVASDAGAESYREASEAWEMFEELYSREKWSDPAEVLGKQVPFAKLLHLAEARIARSTEPPQRLLRIRELLQTAQREATRSPVKAMVETLLELGLTDEGLESALEDARHLYSEKQKPHRRSPR